MLHLIWQLAICMALIHLITVKLPQKPDSALDFIPSTVAANVACIGTLIIRSVPLISWPVFWIMYNVIFVPLLRII